VGPTGRRRVRRAARFVQRDDQQVAADHRQRGDERIKAAFGAAKYERLTQIKSEYDPGNVFAGNQNIRPTVPA
jgi:FAD/FMN-containing dehydrogenase